MADRSPFQLRGLLTAWNIFLAVFSIMGAARFLIILMKTFTILWQSNCWQSFFMSTVLTFVHIFMTVLNHHQHVNVNICRTLPEFIYTISTQVARALINKYFDLKCTFILFLLFWSKTVLHFMLWCLFLSAHVVCYIYMMPQMSPLV